MARRACSLRGRPRGERAGDWGVARGMEAIYESPCRVTSTSASYATLDSPSVYDTVRLVIGDLPSPLTVVVMSMLHVTRPRRDALRLAVIALSLTIGLAFACAAADSTRPSVDAVAPAPARTPAGLWLASTDAPAMLQLAPSQLAAGGHVSPTAVVRAST